MKRKNHTKSDGHICKESLNENNYKKIDFRSQILGFLLAEKTPKEESDEALQFHFMDFSSFDIVEMEKNSVLLFENQFHWPPLLSIPGEGHI